MLETVQRRYKKLGIADNIYQTGAIVTADTGFVNEANMKYLHEHQINRFRNCDPKLAQRKDNYGKRQQTPSKGGWKQVIPASEFQFDPGRRTIRRWITAPKSVFLLAFVEAVEKGRNFLDLRLINN